MIKGGKKNQEPINPAPGRPGYKFDRRVAGFVPVFCSPRFFRFDRQGRSSFNNLELDSLKYLVSLASHSSVGGNASVDSKSTSSIPNRRRNLLQHL